MGKLSFTYLKISLDCLEFISSFSSKATKQLRHSPDPRYNGTYTNSRESCQLQQSLRSQLHSRPPCITSSEEVCCGHLHGRKNWPCVSIRNLSRRCPRDQERRRKCPRCSPLPRHLRTASRYSRDHSRQTYRVRYAHIQE